MTDYKDLYQESETDRKNYQSELKDTGERFEAVIENLLREVEMRDEEITELNEQIGELESRVEALGIELREAKSND